MNKIKFILLILVFFISASFAYSQCCCSSVHFKVLDKKNKPIPKDKIEIKNITERTKSDSSYSVSLFYYPEVAFNIHCGQGDEIISIKYKDKEMFLYLKLRGDFGFAKGQFRFQEGKFLAEFDKETSREWKNFRIKKITKEELESR